MRQSWRIGVGVDLRITARHVEAPHGAAALTAAEAIAWVRWARDDGPRGHAALLEMHEELTGTAPSPRVTVERAVQAVERGLREGKLRGWISQLTEGGGKGPDLPDIPRRLDPLPDQKTFVAIQLLTDEPEPKPVPFKRYRIELPDHTIREGQLDQNGRAQVVGIDPGTCKVSFPDFDATDWKAA